jgi:hypothetical protein
MAEWGNFFLGQLGAAAAFAGLLFVSISVNQSRILQLGHMADRGLEALTILMIVLLVSSIGLVPAQSELLLGSETALLGMSGLVLTWRLQRIYMRGLDKAYRNRTMQVAALSRVALVAIAAGGLFTAATADPSYLRIVAAGVLLSFLAAAANAWVLLVEINR